MSPTPERQQRIDELYHAALELETARRHEFLLESSDGDQELCREVEAILAQGTPGDSDADTATKARANHQADSNRIPTGTLSAGSRLGPYEILGMLGKGGMGVVYSARDTRLGRKVAIKFSQAPLSGRFEREARAISALNHPHICTLYDVGPDYLVMEFIEGPTLAQHLRKGGLSVEQALKYGAQIADALSAAHTNGIVHRDLNPGNIMLTEKGVKVLDFGLAKCAPGPEEHFDATSTATGAVLGTPAYMAPEQLEGRECDARTDIFAFGLVLYEMATGKRAFGGSTQAELIAQVMRCEPNLSDLAPPQVAHLVERCLAKDPAIRWHSAADVKLEIEWIEKSLTTPRAATANLLLALENSKNVPVLPVRRGREGAVLAGSLAALVIIAGLGWFWWAHRTQTEPAAQVKLIPLTTYPGVEQQPSLSPDGSQVAFSWNGPDQKNFDIYVKTTGPGPPLRLTKDPADDISPAWSPDGNSIAFLRKLGGGGQFSVLLMPALGGPERKLTAVSIPEIQWLSGPYLSWSPDGQSLVITDHPSADKPVALYLLSVANGEKRQLTFPPAGVLGDSCVAASPNGTAVAFRRANAPGQWLGSVYVLPLDREFRPRGEPRQLTPQKFFEWACTAWTPDSQGLVFPHELALWTVPLSPGSDDLVRGEPRMIVETGDGVVWPNAARTSARLAYQHKTGGAANIWRVRIPGLHEKPEPPARFIASTRGEFAQQYSPDGKKIVFESYRSSNLEIWVCGGEGEDCTQLTSMGSPQTGVPAWSPDGKQIAFYSNRDGKSQIFVIPAEGGAVRRLTSDSASAMYPRWSRNGEWIYFASKASGQYEIWKAPSRGGAAVQVTHDGGFAASESPDDKWLYFTREFATESSLWKMPVGGGEKTEVLPSVVYQNFAVVDGGVYYETKTAQGFVIEFLNFASGKSEMLISVGEGYAGFSVSPDRRWILYTQNNPESSELLLVEGFR